MPWWRGRSPSAARRRAAILLPSLYGGDATGNDAIAMCETLAAIGFDARLFAENGDPTLGAHPAAAARDFAERDTLVIFHQATQWDHGFELFRDLPGARVVRDHNVTPPEYFEGLSDDFARASVVGIRQRERFARDASIALFVAASAINARELVDLGAEPGRVVVVPPFHRAAELADVAPDEAALRRWSVGGPTALFVGRLAPNKGHRRALRVAAAYAELFGEPLRLRFVGFHDPRWARWIAVLGRERESLGLGSTVDFVGSLTEAELKSAYLTSHVFLCCSEHEGFCVPLVEASELGLPVVAAYQDAVADTLGPSGLVLREASDDALAVAVRRVLRDPELRDAVVAAQRRNVRERFARDRVRDAFLRAIGPIAPRSA